MNAPYVSDLKRDLHSVRPLRPAWQIAFAAVLVSIGIAALSVLMFGYHPPESFSVGSWLLVGLGLAFGIGGCAWAGAHWMSPSGRNMFWKPSLGILLAVMGLMLAAEFGSFAPILAVACFSGGSFSALGAAPILFVVFRRAAPLRRHRVAACAGVLSGLVGFFAIQLHCPIDEAWHMLAGHALLPIAWGLAAYLLARLVWKA